MTAAQVIPCCKNSSSCGSCCCCCTSLCGIFRSALESNAFSCLHLADTFAAAHINTLFNSITVLHCSQLRVAHSALWGKQSAFLCCVLCCQCRASIDFRTFVARLAWYLFRRDRPFRYATCCGYLHQAACSSFSNLNANWGGAHYISFDLVRSSNGLNALINVLKMCTTRMQFVCITEKVFERRARSLFVQW